MVDTSPAASRVFRALIVDDDHDARRLLDRVLSKARVKLDIATAADGREAFDLVPEFRPHGLRGRGCATCIVLTSEAR